MGSIAVACYRPKPDCEDALAALVRGHHRRLSAQGLVTDRAPIMMRCGDGTIVEVFEWVSREKVDAAHSNPAVLAMWKEFEALCSYEIPASIAEFKGLFSHFEPL